MDVLVAPAFLPPRYGPWVRWCPTCPPRVLTMITSARIKARAMVLISNSQPASKEVCPASPHGDARHGCLKTPQRLCVGQPNRNPWLISTCVSYSPLSRQACQSLRYPISARSILYSPITTSRVDLQYFGHFLSKR